MTNSSLPALRPTPSASKLAQLDHPAPGQYWRLTKPLSDLDRNRFRGDSSLEVGQVLLLKAIEEADGTDHVYTFAGHPREVERWNDGERQIHAEELWVYFEPAPDGERVRQRELAELQEEMQETQRQLIAGPPAPEVAGLLSQQPSLTEGGTGQELATREGLLAMTQFAEAAKEGAETQLAWVKEKTGALSECASTLANFHKERAEAMQASIHGKLDEIKKLLKSVGNLQLYTGAGVDVLPLREGDPADADCPVTIYQDLLALDEEVLILVDQGGADHRHVDAISNALADPALLQRLIPAPRGIVLCRFRSTYKEFVKGDSMGAAHVNSHFNAISQFPRLLMRDGERLYLISVDFLEKVKQLLPSTGEQDGYYTTMGGNRISPDSIDYAAAQAQQVARLDDYARVLIVLWGLRDRGEILAESAIPPFSNWLDPAMQVRWLQLVSQDSLLGEEHESFREWQERMNGGLAAGSMVALRCSGAATEEAAPGMFGPYNARTGKCEQVWGPEGDVFIGRARTDGPHLVVDIPCIYTGWDYKKEGRTRQVRVRIDAVASSHIVLLDEASSADFDYFLGSRSQRQNYQAYVTLFRGAREAVREREAQEAPFLAALEDAIAPLRQKHDAPAIQRAALAATRAVRMGAKSKALPSPAMATFRQALARATESVRLALEGGDRERELIEQAAHATGLIPLRLSRSLSGDAVLYVAGDETINDPRLLPQPVFTRRMVLGSGGDLEGDGTQPTVLAVNPSEQVLHQWPEGVEWSKREAPDRLTFSQLAEVASMVGEEPELFHLAEHDPQLLAGLVRRRMLGGRRGFVQNHDVLVTIGVVGGSRDRLHMPRVLGLTVDPLGVLAQASPEGADLAAKLVKDVYKEPAGRLSKLKKPAIKSWRVISMRELLSRRGDRLRWSEDISAFIWGSSLEDVKERGLLCLNAFGARVEPDLVPLCQRPV